MKALSIKIKKIMANVKVFLKVGQRSPSRSKGQNYETIGKALL